jgi:hypothetical protein
MKKVSSVVAVALATFVVTGTARAELITNGSFEAASPGYNAPSGNGEALASGSTAILGWTVFGGVSYDGLAWLPNGDGYGVTTPFGNLFLDLTGYYDQAPYFGVTQTIATTVGDSYDLTFDLGVYQGSEIYSGPIEVSATAGAASQDFTYNPPGQGNQWGGFSLAFTATSTSTAISLQGIEGDEYIGLDNVAVNSVSGVPESTTWGMMLLGFAGLGFVGCFKGRERRTATHTL